MPDMKRTCRLIGYGLALTMLLLSFAFSPVPSGAGTSGSETSSDLSAGGNLTAIPEMVDGYPVPKEFGGLELVLVLTPKNYLCLEPGEVRLLLLAEPDPEIPYDYEALWETVGQLPEGWSVGVGGTSGFSLDEYVARLEKENEDCRKYGPPPKVNSGGPGPVGPPPGSSCMFHP